MTQPSDFPTVRAAIEAAIVERTNQTQGTKPMNVSVAHGRPRPSNSNPREPRSRLDSQAEVEPGEGH